MGVWAKQSQEIPSKTAKQEAFRVSRHTGDQCVWRATTAVERVGDGVSEGLCGPHENCGFHSEQHEKPLEAFE